MAESQVHDLVVDTNVFIASCSGSEPVQKRKRSKAVLEAMYKRRVHWVVSPALNSELNRTVLRLLIPSEEAWLLSWKANMNTLKLQSWVRNVANESLRKEIAAAQGKREHDIHLVEAALATDKPFICSDDDKAGIRFCKLTSCSDNEFRVFSGIYWIDLVDEDMEPVDVVSGMVQPTEVERLRLSTEHPMYVRVTGRQ